MLSSPLLRTLQLLSQEEFETFHFFAASPIFNDRNRFKDTLALFEYLKPHYPHFSSAELIRANVGDALFPDRKSKEEEVNKAMAQLMHILRQFIIFRHFAVRDGQTVRRSSQKEFSDNAVLLLNFARQQIALMHFYRSRLGKNPEPALPDPAPPAGKRIRKADHFFDILHENLRENLKAQTAFQHFDDPEFDEYHLFRFLGEYEKYQYESLTEQRGKDQNILTAMLELDRFYLHSKIDLMIRMAHFMAMATPFPTGSEEFRQWESNVDIMRLYTAALDAQQYLQEPAIQLQCHMLDFLLEKYPATADAKALEAARLIKLNGHLLPLKRIADFRIILRSYWARRYNITRDERQLEHSFNLMLEQLNSDGPEAPVQASHYVNCIMIAIKLGKIAWAGDFAAQYGNRILSTKEPAMVRDIMHALVAFETKDYKTAQATLPHYFNYSALDDIFQYAIAATLDVRIRYELQTLDENESQSMLKATRTYIEREKTLHPNRKAERLLFFKLADRLFKLRQKYLLKKTDHSKELETIRNILDTKAVVDSQWLKEKLLALQAKIGNK
jgi:hypothetical protein